MGYPKINSLWKRQEVTKSLIIGNYACPEFGNVKTWNVTEKIDGTNIRITFLEIEGQKAEPSIDGRTDAAIIPTHLLLKLQPIATWESFDKVFTTPEMHIPQLYREIVFYGEGYGPKIQAAGPKYRSDVGFILFDVKVGDYWLSRENVKDVAAKLGVPVVPDLGIMTEEQIVEFVKSKPLSRCSEKEQVMEGIVARADPMLYFKHSNPVMFKLKVQDFYRKITSYSSEGEKP